MQTVVEKPAVVPLEGERTSQQVGVSETSVSDTDIAGAGRARCFHCGTSCGERPFAKDGKAFCCQGCLTVHELLVDNGLDGFYGFNGAAGIRVETPARPGQFDYLDDPAVRQRLVDFSDGRISRVTLEIPAIHCIACVWLLENLFRLNTGILRSEVNFLKKEVAVTFEPARLPFSQLVALLASLGYEPALKLADLEDRKRDSTSQRLWMQVGVAGFAFGNVMLFSLPVYFGLDGFSGPAFQKVFGYLSLLFALPVLIYSAADYWRSAWSSVRLRMLTIEVPIAAGVAALAAQSAYEVVSGRGPGYFDSLTGLLLFLLCGKLFQRKTYDRLRFDLDYKSFFPLSVSRKTGRTETQVALSDLNVGDRLVIRNGELIPADARLVEGPAVIDYSFVTGESEPVEKAAGDHVYAGGRQMGGAIEIEMVKPVSQSYLTSLWNQEAFRKKKGELLKTLTNTYSQRFTKNVLAIALGAAVFWAFVSPDLSVKAFTSVLIVACPCALALAAPFALGTAQRILACRKVFLKNAHVLETLAQVDTVVFDKTGTLTATGVGSVNWQGAPLGEAEERWLYSMTRHSTHPHAVRIGEAVARQHFPDPVRAFLETPGCGMEGSVAGHEIWMGSAAWLASRQVAVPHFPGVQGSVVHVAINGRYRGCFDLANALRPDTSQLINGLAAQYKLALLSGDNEKERERFSALFGGRADLRFNQSPLNKLGFIRELQTSGKTVMMVGDGLNDAGALQQSDVGVAVVEDIHAFSPASDAIVASRMVPRLHDVLRFSKLAVRVVRLGIVISGIYNVIGISIAAAGLLSPVVCAILMPLSSVTVVVVACGLTSWLGRRVGLEETSPEPSVRNADNPVRSWAAQSPGGQDCPRSRFKAGEQAATPEVQP